MNYNDITIGLVLFKSEEVIFKCLKSIKKVKKIIIYDNSNDLFLKNKIKKIYPNIIYILSKQNIGYGAGNNKIFKIAKTPYVFVLNPDTVLDKNCIPNLIFQSKKIGNNFSIISPSTRLKNYGYFDNHNESRTKIKNILDVDYVKGFSMLVNLRKLKKVNFFDNNFFLYLEEIDLCKRLKKINEKIYIIKNAKIKHLSASSSNIGFEFEKCRNWHWMWSNVYFDMKNKNFLTVFTTSFVKMLNNYLKALFFIFINPKKALIYYLRAAGIFSALAGCKSWYRPKIN